MNPLKNISARYPHLTIIGFAAFSGTGKTTLLEKIIPLLRAQNLRIGIVKHAHHNFDIDQPGKDSYRLRKAGAVETMVASRKRWALVREHSDELAEPDLATLLPRLNLQELDLVLVEGFKHEDFPRIELHRASLGHPYLFPDDSNIIAIASDTSPEQDVKIPWLDINAPADMVQFIMNILQ